MPSVRVAQFTPSSNGLHFDNSFPNEPVRVIDVAGHQIPIGNASGGLCGGMVYTVIDYFRLGLAPPPDTSPPARDTPLFDYIAERLLDSFNLPAGPLRYVELMNPSLPDHDTPGNVLQRVLHSRAHVMIEQEWPKIQRDLDLGSLSPMGLVKVKSWNLNDLGVNHHVLAYGYDLDGTTLTLHLYDPNCHDNDAVAMALDIATPNQTIPVAYTPNNDPDHPVLCFFRSDYTPRDPREMAGLGGHP